MCEAISVKLHYFRSACVAVFLLGCFKMCAEKIDVVKKPKKQKQIQVQNLALNKFTGGAFRSKCYHFCLQHNCS